MCTSPANRRLNVEVYVLTILMPHLGLGFSPWWASLMWMNMCEVLSPNLSYRPADSPPGRHGGQWSQRDCKVTLPRGCSLQKLPHCHTCLLTVPHLTCPQGREPLLCSLEPPLKLTASGLGQEKNWSDPRRRWWRSFILFCFASLPSLYILLLLLLCCFLEPVWLTQ